MDTKRRKEERKKEGEKGTVRKEKMGGEKRKEDEREKESWR